MDNKIVRLNCDTYFLIIHFLDDLYERNSNICNKIVFLIVGSHIVFNPEPIIPFKIKKIIYEDRKKDQNTPKLNILLHGPPGKGKAKILNDIFFEKLSVVLTHPAIICDYLFL